jgi:hypothetical protein
MAESLDRGEIEKRLVRDDPRPLNVADRDALKRLVDGPEPQWQADNEEGRRIAECMWRNNENHLQIIYNAIARGIITPESYESRIAAEDMEQDALEWALGLEFWGRPGSKRWSGMP